MSLKEFISSLDGRQQVAVLKDEKILWMGNASQLQQSRSNVYRKLLSFLVRGTQLPHNAYDTYCGGESQRWNCLIINV